MGANSTGADAVWIDSAVLPAGTLQMLLNVKTVGSGTGTVTSNPAGINCGLTCWEYVASGSTVTLTATPGAGTAFVGWSGDCAGTVASCLLTLSNAKSVTATFAAPDDNFPPGGQMPVGWTTDPGSSAGWIVANDTAYRGLYSLKSASITDFESAGVQVAGTYPAGNISFAYRVSSELNFDKFNFYIDDVAQLTGPATVSGEVPWTPVSFPVAAGAHTFKWVYAKDGTESAGADAAWIDSVLLPVVRANTSTTISAHTPNPSLVGAPIAVTASVAVTPPGTGTPTGTITVSDGTANCLITLPATSCNLVPTSVGAKTLTASYAGDANFNGSTSPGVAHTVNKASTTSTISAHTPNPSLVGAPIAVTASVAVTPPGTGTPTGTITVSDGSGQLSDHAAGDQLQSRSDQRRGEDADRDLRRRRQLQRQHLARGRAHRQQGQHHLDHQRAHAESVAGRGADRGHRQRGGDATGHRHPHRHHHRQRRRGQLSDHAAGDQLQSRSEQPGAKTLTATYAGDANFNGSTSPGVAHTVNNANSSTALATSGTPSVFGQSVTFTATVTGTTPTGSVTFMDGATTLCNAVTLVSGQAPCLTSALSVASHSLTAVYSGDGINSGSTSAPLTQVVNKAATTSTLSAHTPNPSLVGAPIAVTASVAVTPPGTGTPTGTITVSDGTANCLITLPATSCNLVPSSVGAKTLTASYAGDANFNGSTSPGVAHTVNKASTTSTLSAHTPNPSLVGCADRGHRQRGGDATGHRHPHRHYHRQRRRGQLSDHAAGDQLQSRSDQPWGEDADRDLRRRRQLQRQHLARGRAHRQ